MKLEEYIEDILNQSIQKPNNRHVIVTDNGICADQVLSLINKKISDLPTWLLTTRGVSKDSFVFKSGSTVSVIFKLDDLRGYVVDTIGHYCTSQAIDLRFLADLHKVVKEVTVIKVK